MSTAAAGYRTERAISIQEEFKALTVYDKIKETFKKVDCIRFIPHRQKSPAYCQCGLLRDHHIPECVDGGPDEVWDPDDGNYTRHSPTDAFGELEFQGVWTSTRAKYIRVAHDTPESDILHLLTDIWNLPLPKLIIEVTGGAKDFVLQPKLRRVFRKGIVKVAESTDAWILTGGTNTGVMKHVGKALREHTLRSKHKIHAIGVVSWGIVVGNSELQEREKKQHARVRHYRMTSSMESNRACLDPNHTHFILVDNGTTEKFGVEIALRSRLEKLVSMRKMDPTASYHIPAVCLVLEGGLNTIRVVLENITKDPAIPVVIADGSGRGADLIAYAYSKSDREGIIPPEHEKQLREKIADTFPKDAIRYDSLYDDLSEAMKQKNLITIYRVEEEVDIDYAILNALMKASNLSQPDQLKLSLMWNRVDLAKEKIFNRKLFLDDRSLEEAMVVALVRNRVEFVKLLLETGFNMKEFVTDRRLEHLYNSIQNMGESEPCPSLGVLYQQADVILPKNDNGCHTFMKKNIDQVIQYLLGKGFTFSDSSNSEEGRDRCSNCCSCFSCLKTKEIDESSSGGFGESDKYPFNDLFLWAILTKKFAIARLMWQRGRGTLAKALVGGRLCYRMANVAKKKYNTDAVDRLMEETKWYNNLAVELLSQCFQEDATYTCELLCAQLKNWSEQTCLSLAASYNHSRFIAHPSIQFLLNDQWYGAFSKISTLKELDDFLFPTDKSREDAMDSCSHSVTNKNGTGNINFDRSFSMESDTGKSSSLRRRTSVISLGSLGSGIGTLHRRLAFVTREAEDLSEKSFFEKSRLLLVAPIVKFWINTIFYFLFLMMFSFVVLVDLQGDIMMIEWAVTCTIFTLATEELRQLMMMGEHGRTTLWQKMKMWASDKWNIWDLIGVLLYIPGFVLRLCSVAGIVPAEEPYARILFSLDVMVWYIRLLDVCSVNNVIGPYVNMIGRMIRDLAYFMVILLVFVVSYGVARQAIISPRSKWKWSILGEIFFLPYWQVYGELFPDDNFPSEVNDPSLLGYSIVTMIMVIFLMISNVLLLNLLIAKFNNTFNRVHDNASEIWKFERYRLIMEYSQKPFLPPPFTIVIHIILLIRKLLNCCRAHVEAPVGLGEYPMQRLYNFEEECTENYLRQQALKEQYSVNNRVQRISERVDSYGNILEEQHQPIINNRDFLKKLSERVDSIDKSLQHIVEHLKTGGSSDHKIEHEQHTS
ncbi:transient receptor potential cation channel subfamily M member 1-like [Asterias rubens]|uniref:transient receptor potential cation channel subfamily M member 1-like n=1 Tax=Asterias rubens TaxID=7604 RepID=UPI001455A641|nr:transient receptor potential cation channel subfamily M member 1-like [Asterias rubens]